jgi:peptide/nickel transport system permease protein
MTPGWWTAATGPEFERLTMANYVLRRTAHAVLVLWCTFTAAFFLLYALPGDAALSKLNVSAGGQGLSVEAVKALRQSLGLDQPILVQYYRALTRALHGDFGLSVQTGGDALKIFAEGVPQTLELAAVALTLGLVLGSGVAIAAAYVRWAPLKLALQTLPALGVSIPSFWIGLVLLQLFSFHWRLFPAMGNDGVATLVLPAIVLSIPTAALVAQILSRGLQTALASAYVETARARGATRARILLVHALRNSIIPMVTALAMTTGHLIAGSVVVETVFSRSGIGLTTVQAVLFQDTPVVLVAVVFAATVFVTVNLLVDLIYPLIDPRIDIGIARSRRQGVSP